MSRANFQQDWLYDEGEDATKAVYTSKIEELRMAAGPIIQRYLDKRQEEIEAVQKRDAEEAARKKAEKEAAAKAAEEAKAGAQGGDVDMKDAPDGKQEAEVEEMD